MVAGLDPPNISVGVGEKATQDVDRQNAQPTLRLDVHYREDSLVEDGVTDVLTGVCVCGHLERGEGGEE